MRKNVAVQKGVFRLLFWYLAIILLSSAGCAEETEIQRPTYMDEYSEYKYFEYGEEVSDELRLIHIISESREYMVKGDICTLDDLCYYLDYCLWHAFDKKADYEIKVREFDSWAIYYIFFSNVSEIHIEVSTAPDTNQARDWEKTPLERIPETQEEFDHLLETLECPPGNISACGMRITICGTATWGGQQKEVEMECLFPVYNWDPYYEYERGLEISGLK